MLAAKAVLEALGSPAGVNVGGLDRTEIAPRHLTRLRSWPSIVVENAVSEHLASCPVYRGEEGNTQGLRLNSVVAASELCCHQLCKLRQSRDFRS
jgi:hypothetical protein